MFRNSISIIQKMNLQKKGSLIELGGQNFSAGTITRITPLQSPTKVMPPLPSREIIESSHRLPLKLSPTKNNYDHLRNKSRTYENDSSRTDLDQSKLSIKSKIAQLRPYLADRSNINMTSPSKIRISYHDSNRNSPASSRTSSHTKPIIQTLVKPSIAQQVPGQPSNSPQTPREVELERKLKILQARIGQLHREKQEAVGKLNQENRKIYHENTSLKLKINELSKRAEKSQAFQSTSNIERTESIYQNSQALENAQLEVKHLKKQIQELQTELASSTTKVNCLKSANNDLSAELGRITIICSLQKEEISQKVETCNQQEEQISRLHQDHLNAENQLEKWKNSKENHEIELTAIKSQMQENEQRYSMILKEYQTKIEEYQTAYNQNQSLIKQLEEQLKAYEEHEIIKEEVLEESQVHNNELSNECMELENNLTQAIQEREALIITLQTEKQYLEEQISIQEERIQDLILSDQDKTKKLEDASLLLETMTQRFQEISERYSELTEKYQIEKSKMNKSEGFQGKCKKCDELLRTVLRLNTQLNPKKVG